MIRIISQIEVLEIPNAFYDGFYAPPAPFLWLRTIRHCHEWMNVKDLLLMTMLARATLVLAEHRPETVPHAAALMRDHEAVFLEEPPDASFQQMLRGDLPVEEYVLTLDAEYPAFIHSMCLALRELSVMGISICQVEPYLEHLVAIHEFFSSGGSPEKLDPHHVHYEVYLAEKKATAALLEFYKTATAGSFEETLESVKRFARVDSRRFLVRDRMRAEALAPMIRRFNRSYIEAGQIHYLLWRMLRQNVGDSIPVRPHFLMGGTVKSMRISRHLYGPGDILTLRYILRPDLPDPMEDLLAARALIYNKLIRKDEMADGNEPYPHIRDELQVIEVVKQLTLKNCAELFSLVRKATTHEARAAVAHYLRSAGRKGFPYPE
jgi:hypothetical protein